jgi:DNA-binding response OmpR family regulator
LLVDEPPVVDPLAEQLRADGLEVVTASGVEAVDHASRVGDVVVAPFRSAAGTATQLLRVARARDRGAQLVLTATAAELPQALPASRHGASDVLLRPVNLALLRPAIELALDRHALARARAVLVDELLTAGRLASIHARLRSAIHHLNNPLTSLVASARYVSEGLSELRRVEALLTAPAALQAWWESEGRPLADELAIAASDAVESADRIHDIARELGSIARDASTGFDLGSATISVSPDGTVVTLAVPPTHH